MPSDKKTKSLHVYIQGYIIIQEIEYIYIGNLNAISEINSRELGFAQQACIDTPL